MKRIVSSLSVLVSAAVAGPALVILPSCGGDNLFEPLEKKDDKDKGKNALQDGDYDKAIEQLTKYVAEHPNDAEARSMLANAHMKKVGIDTLKLAAQVATSKGNDWKTIVGAMPTGSAQNVESLQDAVEALSAIPPVQRTQEQSYQLALAQASLAVTLAKQATGGGTSISDAKVDSMSDAQAEEIYDVLKDSKSTIEASSALNGNEGAQKLSGLSEKIASSEGTSDADKMKAFLKKNN